MALWLALTLWRQLSVPSPGRTLLPLGSLAAVMAATKITLAGTACLPLPALLARQPPRSGRLVVWLLLFGATAVGGTALLCAVSYLFNPAALAASWKPWFPFVSNPGSEPAFWTSLFRPWSLEANPDADYTYALAPAPICLVLILTAAGQLLRFRDERWPLLAVLLTIVFLMGL